MNPVTSVHADVVVIGAGAAGLVAAYEARRHGVSVVLLEKNAKAGVKILMSGGTRCNITQDTDARGITEAFAHAKRFLQPSVGAFPPSDVIAMFNGLGVATKREPTGKIFPQSNRAVHVRDALLERAVTAGVELRLNSAVEQMRPRDSGWSVFSSGNEIRCRRLIITAGGRSWPGCGTTGDAYGWLSELGHTIVRPVPALVPLTANVPWMNALSGLAVEQAVVTVKERNHGKNVKKPLLQRKADWLFTHFGFSGPGAMDASRYVTTATSERIRTLTLDLVPDLEESEIDRQLSDRGIDGGRKKVANIVSQYLPSRLAAALVDQCQCDRAIADLPAKSRRELVRHIKNLPIPVTGSRGFDKAEVTAGGVELAEVDPRTMASRKAGDLFIAGEVLDVDGWIGGYNFQAAFATGRAAGIAAATSCTKNS